MAKYELAICVVDETDHRIGAKRKKEGDIVAIKPYPWNWGAKEIDEYLILIIETTRSFEYLDTLIRQRVYRDKVNNIILKQNDYENLIDPDIGARKENEFELIYKRRFQISHGKVKTSLTDLDFAKVRNKTIKYQPFKNRRQLIQKFNGLKNNRLITKQDCDCNSIHATNNKEFSINLDVTPAIILDKFTKKLVKL